MMLLKALRVSRHTYIGKAVAKLFVMRKFEWCEVDPKYLTCKCPTLGFIEGRRRIIEAVERSSSDLAECYLFAHNGNTLPTRK
jgi:hypothetical protein